MNGRLRKVVLLAMAVLLLSAGGLVQKSLNQDRTTLGLTRMEPLENAPPVLAFTTVALGGFRGLISNVLWIRANDLQDEDRFFEMQQLAEWITKLQPHFVQVWLVQAWNMAYNISVKFKDYSDRWRWVKAGISLLRDDGLRFNKNELLIYRELAWFFQHKMGQNLDDANMHYKQQWANEMAQVFGKKAPDLDELIEPKTEDAIARRKLLVETYKMDPAFMKELNEKYGPLEWRLPEAHAIYWAAKGLEQAKSHPERVKHDDIITLRRVIYQSMQMSFHRGRLVANPFVKAFEFGPNLDIIPKVSAAYEQAAEEDKNMRDHILRAHRNFLKDAVYFLYSHNRIADAAKWYRYLGEKYPDNTILDFDTNSYPRNLTLDQYAVKRVAEDINETSRDRVQSALEGLLLNAYMSQVIGEDDRAAGFRLLARRVWETYMNKIAGERQQAIGLRPLKEIDDEILRRILDPNEGPPTEVRATLRTMLGLPPEAPPQGGTNTIQTATGTAAPSSLANTNASPTTTR
jgi:hypothetical protein